MIDGVANSVVMGKGLRRTFDRLVNVTFISLPTLEFQAGAADIHQPYSLLLFIGRRSHEFLWLGGQEYRCIIAYDRPLSPK